jgi:biopolymer transport protein ExbD
VILNLIPDGSVIFAGQNVEKIDFLTGLLNREISAAQLEGVAPAKIAVIIRSHQDTPTGLVQELITKCQALELEDFSLRVKERQQ